MQSAVSRQKQLSVVFGVANAQKQGAADAECTEAEDATMFQELVQNCRGVAKRLVGAIIDRPNAEL